MTWLDVGLIVILAAFTAKGVMQGMLRQIIGLVSVLAALLIAGAYYAKLAKYIAYAPTMRIVAEPAAYAVLLIGVWSLITLAGVMLYDEAGRDTDAYWLDDVAGGVLGLLTGIFLLVALVLGASVLGLGEGIRAAQSQVMRWVISLAYALARRPI